MPSVYSDARLEGSALEAWLKWFAAIARLSPGQPNPAEPTTILVRARRGSALVERGSDWDPRVGTALAVVKPRARAVARGLSEAEVEIRGAACLARHAPGSTAKTSVDIRIRSKRPVPRVGHGERYRPAGRGQHGLIEVKWSRHRLSKAIRAAKGGLVALRRIRKRGRWVGPIAGRTDPQPRARKRACAQLVGTLCVCRGGWQLQLYQGNKRKASKKDRVEKRIQVRSSGSARRQARDARQQQVPALEGEEPRDSSSDSAESSEPSSSSSESSSESGSNDEHDGYSTDSV